MSTVKKIITLLLFCITTTSGCALDNSPARVIVPESVKLNNSASEAGSVITDVGKGKKGADIAIGLKFDQNFNTKSENGGRTGKVADIASAKVYLTIVRQDPLNTNGFLIAETGPIIFNPVTDSGTKLFIFKNVPPAIFTGPGNTIINVPYSIAVELFNADGESLIEPAIYSGQTVQPPASFPGGKRGIALSDLSVQVQQETNKLVYIVNPSGIELVPQPTPPLPPLQVFPHLKNAFAAIIDTTITPTDGVYPSGISVEFPN